MTKGLLATEDRHANKKRSNIAQGDLEKLVRTENKTESLVVKIWVTRSADQIAGVFWGEPTEFGVLNQRSNGACRPHIPTFHRCEQGTRAKIAKTGQHIEVSNAARPQSSPPTMPRRPRIVRFAEMVDAAAAIRLASLGRSLLGDMPSLP